MPESGHAMIERLSVVERRSVHRRWPARPLFLALGTTPPETRAASGAAWPSVKDVARTRVLPVGGGAGDSPSATLPEMISTGPRTVHGRVANATACARDDASPSRTSPGNRPPDWEPERSHNGLRAARLPRVEVSGRTRHC